MQTINDVFIFKLGEKQIFPESNGSVILVKVDEDGFEFEISQNISGKIHTKTTKFKDNSTVMLSETCYTLSKINSKVMMKRKYYP